MGHVNYIIWIRRDFNYFERSWLRVPAIIMSASRDNPYLQHLPPDQRGAGHVGNGPVGAAAKEPLYGFLQRKVTSEQVSKAMVRILLCISNFNTHQSILPIGTWYKSLHETTTLCTIQEDTGRTEETACVRPDGRILQDGEWCSLIGFPGTTGQYKTGGRWVLHVRQMGPQSQTFACLFRSSYCLMSSTLRFESE